MTMQNDTRGLHPRFSRTTGNDLSVTAAEARLLNYDTYPIREAFKLASDISQLAQWRKYGDYIR